MYVGCLQIRPRSFNHLVFVIHGIGQHIDFRDGEFKSWTEQTGIEGGNHAFRDIFRGMLETTFRDIPMALEMQSIEWHEDLHEPTGLDNIFDLISPEGASVYVAIILYRGFCSATKCNVFFCGFLAFASLIRRLLWTCFTICHHGMDN